MAFTQADFDRLSAALEAKAVAKAAAPTRSARTPDPVSTEPAKSSFDTNAHYECLCGEILANWSCPAKCAAEIPAHTRYRKAA